MHPLAFIAFLVVALVAALALLLVSPDDPNQLTEAEVEALVRAAQPAPAAPPSSASERTAPPRSSRLHLVSEPSGAAVHLDGELVGRTPLSLSDLEPAFYTVTLRLPDHAPLDTSIYLASRSLLALSVALVSESSAESPPASGTPGPDAVADARPVERVPQPTPTAREEAVREEQRGAAAGGGSPPRPRAIPRPAAPRPAAPKQTTPKPASAPSPTFANAPADVLRRVSNTGSLSVSSSPAGAEVLVDGVPHGAAPLSLSGLRPGQYVVTLTLPGHTPLSYRSEVVAQAVSVVQAAFPSN